MNGLIEREQSIRTELTAKFAAMTDAELSAAIQGALRRTVEDILFLGLAVCEAKKRGRDLEDMVLNGLVQEYHRVGCGQVLAAVMHRYWLKTAARKRVSALPLPDQEKCVSDKCRIPVLVPGPDGRDETKLMDPINMAPSILAQVFDGPVIRDEEQQGAWLADKKRKALLPKRQVPGWDMDRERRLFKKGRLAVTFDEIDQMYAAKK